jgi:hypothetical protein
MAMFNPEPAGVTAFVGALVAGKLDPNEFVAVTVTVRVLPISATTGT